MRLDFYLSHVTDLSRKEAKSAIAKDRVKVNGVSAKKANMTVFESDSVSLDDNVLSFPGEAYYLLYKPAGYVCATEDSEHPIVVDLISSHSGPSLHIVGRLDKDTTGLLLLTTDGQWLHRITSPRKACSKRYRVNLAQAIEEDAIHALEKGVMLNGESQPTLPAHVERLCEKEIYLTIQEGKYHQVKRMLAAVGNRVIALHRDQIGPLSLDENLQEGQYRALTEEEIAFF